MESSFRDLIVWQQAVGLVETIYMATGPFPRSEDYALTSQMRRAAVSIPSNIAEGSGRGTKKDFQSFLRVAQGSARELETQIVIASLVKYIDSETAASLQNKLLSVSRLLSRLIASLDKPAST